jgi:hypothetical protein
MSESESVGDRPRPTCPSPDELIQIIRGVAPPGVRQRFLAAYDDPTSELHEVLLSMEEWVHGLRARVRGLVENDASRSDSSFSRFARRLKIVEDFVGEKRAKGLLSEEELQQILSAGQANTPPQTAREAMMRIVEINRRLDDRHPELHQELVTAILTQEPSHTR